MLAAGFSPSTSSTAGGGRAGGGQGTRRLLSSHCSKSWVQGSPTPPSTHPVHLPRERRSQGWAAAAAERATAVRMAASSSLLVALQWMVGRARRPHVEQQRRSAVTRVQRTKSLRHLSSTFVVTPRVRTSENDFLFSCCATVSLEWAGRMLPWKLSTLVKGAVARTALGLKGL